MGWRERVLQTEMGEWEGEGGRECVCVCGGGGGGEVGGEKAHTLN